VPLERLRIPCLVFGRLLDALHLLDILGRPPRRHLLPKLLHQLRNERRAGIGKHKCQRPFRTGCGVQRDHVRRRGVTSQDRPVDPKPSQERVEVRQRPAVETRFGSPSGLAPLPRSS
jgi:hypothetical protein